MATFYARYPATVAAPTTVTTVQGEGTAGSPVGGLLTVQGDPSGTPIPISGNITASAANVAPTGAAVPADAGYAGMNVAGNLVGLTGTASGLKVDGSAVTQPVSAAALPLPSGASTSAKQPALGAAGTASTDVLTVQGIAAMTPLLVTQSGTGTTQPTNVTQFGGSNVVTGTGTGGAGIPRVTVSSDSNVLATQSGTWNVGTVTTVTAVTAISNALPAGTNLLGKAGIDQTTPGTTNAIQATSGTTAAWQAEGAIAAGSITSSYATVFTPSASTKMLFMRNNTNASVTVSMDAGTTANFVLDSGDQIAVDFIANGLVSTTAAIQIKSTGSPSTGSFRVNGCH